MNNPIPEPEIAMEPRWYQPNRKEIFFGDGIAIISKETFNKLLSHSYVEPKHLFKGQMWKGFKENTNYWYLYWYDGGNTHKLEIKIMDWRNLMNI